MKAGSHLPLREGRSERERLEMRKEQAILDSQREAREMARARRFRRIRSLTPGQLTYLAAAVLFALLLALVAIE